MHPYQVDQCLYYNFPNDHKSCACTVFVCFFFLKDPPPPETSPLPPHAPLPPPPAGPGPPSFRIPTPPPFRMVFPSPRPASLSMARHSCRKRRASSPRAMVTRLEWSWTS